MMLWGVICDLNKGKCEYFNWFVCNVVRLGMVSPSVTATHPDVGHPAVHDLTQSPAVIDCKLVQPFILYVPNHLPNELKGPVLW